MSVSSPWPSRLPSPSLPKSPKIATSCCSSPSTSATSVGSRTLCALPYASRKSTLATVVSSRSAVTATARSARLRARLHRTDVRPSSIPHSHRAGRHCVTSATQPDLQPRRTTQRDRWRSSQSFPHRSSAARASCQKAMSTPPSASCGNFYRRTAITSKPCGSWLRSASSSIFSTTPNSCSRACWYSRQTITPRVMTTPTYCQNATSTPEHSRKLASCVASIRRTAHFGSSTPTPAWASATTSRHWRFIANCWLRLRSRRTCIFPSRTP